MFFDFWILPLLKHFLVDLIADPVNQEMVEDVSDVGGPVEEQFEKYFF